MSDSVQFFALLILPGVPIGLFFGWLSGRFNTVHAVVFVLVSVVVQVFLMIAAGLLQFYYEGDFSEKAWFDVKLAIMIFLTLGWFTFWPVGNVLAFFATRWLLHNRQKS
ncbi:MAG: hypothetical protein AAF393_10060 [Pseudomonadota bacterium]